MNTVLYIHKHHGDAARCELLWGEPLEVLAAPGGTVLVFGPGAIVAYVLHARRRRHVYVFRTLEVSDPLAASVPGVRPRVQLLLDSVSAGRVHLVRGLFAYLVRTGHAPSDLPDGFFVRVSAALSGRLPQHKILVALLQASLESPRTRASGRGARMDQDLAAQRSWASMSATAAWLASSARDQGRQ
jgi:hypothetical protein